MGNRFPLLQRKKKTLHSTEHLTQAPLKSVGICAVTSVGFGQGTYIPGVQRLLRLWLSAAAHGAETHHAKQELLGALCWKQVQPLWQCFEKVLSTHPLNREALLPGAEGELETCLLGGWNSCLC